MTNTKNQVQVSHAVQINKPIVLASAVERCYCQVTTQADNCGNRSCIEKTYCALFVPLLFIQVVVYIVEDEEEK